MQRRQASTPFSSACSEKRCAGMAERRREQTKAPRAKEAVGIKSTQATKQEEQVRMEECKKACAQLFTAEVLRARREIYCKRSREEPPVSRVFLVLVPAVEDKKNCRRQEGVLVLDNSRQTFLYALDALISIDVSAGKE